MSAAYIPSRVAGTFNAMFDLTPREREDLIRNGVSENIIDKPTPIRAGMVRFVDSQTFVFEQHDRLSLQARHGRAFLFLVEDDGGDPLDIVAWTPTSNRHRLATWAGRAWGLGRDEAFVPRVAEHDALPIHRDPLAWLRAGRRGCVILRPRLAADVLCDASPLLAEDTEHGVQLRRELSRPAPRIIVPSGTQRRTAA